MRFGFGGIPLTEDEIARCVQARHSLRGGIVARRQVACAATLKALTEGLRPAYLIRARHHIELSCVPIRDYQMLMQPLLTVLDGVEHRFSQVLPILAHQFHLTAEERAHLLQAVRNRLVGSGFQRLRIDDLAMVNQNIASWNPLASWLRKIDDPRRAVFA